MQPAHRIPPMSHIPLMVPWLGKEESDEVRRVIDIHMAGEDRDNLLWPMLMLELWARTWLD